MYNIALCDDEAVFAQMHESLCRDICSKLGIMHQISVFGDSAEFFKSVLSENNRYDLILLDILMPGMDGMSLAEKIRASDKDASIIFITSTRDYLARGYDVRALHYLEKPVDRLKLEKLIAADYTERFQNSYIILDSDEGKRKAAIRDIICMETAARRVCVTLSDGSAYYHGKLSELLSKLPEPRFVRCHQAFAVNIAQIRELTKKDVVTVTGAAVPMSRKYAADVKKAFAGYLRNF